MWEQARTLWRVTVTCHETMLGTIGTEMHQTTISLISGCIVCRVKLGMKEWIVLARSNMDQVEIVRRTRALLEESKSMPTVSEVDPTSTRVETETTELANKLMEVDWEELTEDFSTTCNEGVICCYYGHRVCFWVCFRCDP